ncbi:hypothetical protein DCO58_00390 [Helicobacter saguini]|uniref:Lipoprotein n=1 Tax=Helicobacter saguini TaxID=1548018 RepID=A0A347VQU9_9HELI|nr:hypothetical protein [Helicobacter saguini]MWV63149.1 hypothetical protein [Helicobacter saguini]MWV66181.1 hypothetical protein [Helicobacter saguini]MWV68530.1 hypothetical protein [Helicobacter saguini]MWV71915.1 hypothetical protein [Helicobacter saguini]TLD95929.1 hypothetical protein LS64_000765 [Helicobacter saguini]
MKTKFLIASALSALFFTACSFDSGSNSAQNSQLVPPAAGGPALAPLSVPTYPPVGYNANPSLAASAPVGNTGIISQPTAPVQGTPVAGGMPMAAGPMVPASQYDYNPTPRYDRGDYSRNQRSGSGGYEQGFERNAANNFDDMRRNVAASESDVSVGIQNSPLLTPNNVIEIQAVGMGVAPESTISPAQALALAKRAAIVDAYRQIGEKMYGIRINANDTIRDAIAQNSTIKGRVQALIKNAEITETAYKDGLCQVNMEVKLDGRIWHRVLNNA